MATRSMPTVSSLPASLATSTFEPTPSAAATGLCHDLPSPSAAGHVLDQVDRAAPRSDVDAGATVRLVASGRWGDHRVSSANFDGPSSPSGTGYWPSKQARQKEPVGAPVAATSDPRLRYERESAPTKSRTPSTDAPAAISSARVDMSIP